MYNLTKRARHVIDYFAQSEGRRIRSDSLGPEHIFLGLLKDQDSTAMKLLQNLGVNFDILRRSIEQGFKTSSNPVNLGTIPVSSRFNKLIELAREESKKLRSSFIGTEHLLLSLFRDGSVSAIESLIAAGIDYNVLYDEIVKSQENRDGGADDSGKQKNKVNSLSDYTLDLTSLASKGQLEPVIGREKEIDRMIHILSRKTKNNPVIIGDSGVGKTAIVEGLAQRIHDGKVPAFLEGKKILSLDITGIVAGTKFRGDFEDRMKRIIKEIKSDHSIILFIDEIHTMLGAGAAEGAIDAANILKPFLARGEVQCIGATTAKEYRRYVEKDQALERRFQRVIVDEPTVEQTIEILQGLIHRYEEHHRVHYTREAMQSAVILSKRYIHDRFLPDKAIDCIDEAGAIARIRGDIVPGEIISLENEILVMQKEKEELVNSQEFERAAHLRDQLNEKKNFADHKRDEWKKRTGEYSITVDRDVILDVIERWTGIQVTDSLDENERYLDMEKFLSERIIGQENPISTIARVLRRNRAGIRKGVRPVSSFLFVGPTGVGKTEMAKVIAEFIFGTREAMIRVDMSEYMEKHAVARLIGSPPGYVGYEEGGQITERIRKKPYAIVLFDEIEKAHHDFFNILLQILDEGELTDGTGRKVSFKDALIIMTSNIGNSRFDTTKSIGFSENNADRGLRDKVFSEIKKSFNPEFINRIDEIVYFKTLEKSEIDKIIDLHLDELVSRIQERGVSLSIDDQVRTHLYNSGFSPEWGARHVRRLIEREIEDRVAHEILKEKNVEGLSLVAVINNDKISIEKTNKRKVKKKETISGSVKHV